MNTDDHEEFDYQLDKVDVKNYKIKSLITNNESLNNDLFNEYLNTKKVPSCKLYTRQFISDEEWHQSHADGHSDNLDLRVKSRNTDRLMMEKIREFHELQNKGAINPSLYDYDINETNTIKALKEVDQKLTLFKKSINSQHTSNYATDGEVFAHSIFRLIQKFKSPLWINEISNLILEDDENIHIYSSLSAYGSFKDDIPYKRLKEYFDFHFQKLLSQYNQSNVGLSNKTADKLVAENLRLEDSLLGLKSEDQYDSKPPNGHAKPVKELKNLKGNGDKDKLTVREHALIHCYKQLPPIKKGEPMYDDYIGFATPRKRLAYPGDSKRKADLLIKSIENVLLHLDEIERQQAESEIVTIEAKFSN